MTLVVVLLIALAVLLHLRFPPTRDPWPDIRRDLEDRRNW